MTDRERVVVITGATGKLGPAVARAFADSGARLALIARSGDEVDSLAKSLGSPPGAHVGVAAELGSAEGAVAAATEVRERLGPAAVLIHLVGGYAGGSPFEAAPEEEWRHLIDLNLWSTIHTIRAFLPDIRTAEHGRVITVSTSLATAPGPNIAAYAATKAAVESLTLSVARDLAGTAATANVVLIRTIGAEKSTHTRPEEIAAAMLWLCSAEAAAVNGQRIPLVGRA